MIQSPMNTPNNHSQITSQNMKGKLMRGIIVAPQPEAVEAGATILKKGGNAIDAAIACAFVQGVVDPQMSGIGGFGSMQVYMPKRGVHEMLEFYCKAPLAATPDMWESALKKEAADGFAFMLENQQNEIGYQSIGTPGSLKGYTEALSSYGRFDLADVMAPAIAQAERGFVVRPHVHWYWTQDQSRNGQVNIIDKLRFSKAGRSVYFHPDGKLKGLGERVYNPDLAQTLKRIAQHGPDLFYNGEMAEEFIDDMQANGGLLTMEDLRQYELTKTAPLWGTYRGHEISTSQPPASGPALLQFLNIMEQFDLSSYPHNSVEHIALMSEAMRRMTIDKDLFIGDPLYDDLPVDRLISKEYAAELAQDILSGRRAEVSRYSSVESEPKDTTTVVACDSEGNIAALTHTIASPSGVITNGHGFMWNGCMSRFDPRPGHAKSLAPGKRRASSQAPTIMFKDQRPVLAVSAPGGGYIAPAIGQCVMNILDYKMSIQEAIFAPRAMAISNAIDVSNRIPNFVTDVLAADGYKINRSYQSYPFAGLHGIQMSASGDWTGCADPQRDGMALVV
ncbi:gamma-glutamyltransferase [Thalassospira alkalitolerans]|uniref:gamma-glutamyltransferase n=1 Tax=Thalassospira alkalitolerans TaxID=1293890 RepID=UPI003AA88DEF